LNVPTVVAADDAILERILDTTYPTSHQGLSRSAFTKLDAAQRKTIWGLGHERRFALVEQGEVLASAQRYALNGTLDRRRVSICGIGAVCTDPSHGNEGHAEVLVERLIDEAKRDGADMAIVFVSTDPTPLVSDGFEVIPTTDVELTVAESPRHGAPMTMVRGGEDRDLAAIVAMGEARASPFRFHLERDVDFVKYTMTRKRLLAGLGSAGVRQFHFVIAEEGFTAAAYVVISSVGGSWTIEECGDRDASGARVGAILQALIAREPVERRPVIHGSMPAGFVPPQVTIVSTKPTAEVILARRLSPSVEQPRLSSEQVLYWRSDIF
jgi:Acetyltransferase (GNAT) domain